MPHIDQDVKLDFKDVLLRPKRSTLKSRQDVVLHREIEFRNSRHHYTGVPLMASNMDTVGTFEMALALAKYDCFTCIHKHYSVEAWREFAQTAGPSVLQNVAISAGMFKGDLDKIEAVTVEFPQIKFICLDVANGYSEHFVQFVKDVRSKFPTHTIIAGNVVTGEMVEELILAGADMVKVGIGPGSVCTTRKKAGVGYPQFSAVLECADAAHGLNGHIISDGGCSCPECADAAHGLNGHIISDGGCSCPGDVAKAFGAGADFVMVGGMLAGHDQSGGDLIVRDNKRFKQFYGMASKTAMKKYNSSEANYRAAEGKTVEVPYRGCVESTIQDILGGIRSACTYTGSLKLKEIPKRATFIRCLAQVNEIFTQFETKA